MIHVSCAIIVRKNKILVTQRDIKSGHPLKWEFPGGKQEQNETIEECLLREIKEELDVELKIKKKLSSVIHNYEFGKIKLIPFICIIINGTIELREHHDLQWITFEDYTNLDFTPADLKLIQLNKNKTALQEYLRENMHNT